MTSDEYRACVRAFGLTPIKPAYAGSTIHQDKDGMPHSIPDPEGLSEDERRDFIEILKVRLGHTNH